MFDTLTERLSSSLRNLSGTSQLTEDNIKDTLREVRMALLEADVALPKDLQPGQAFVKIVHDELTEMMGSANQALEMTGKPPVVYLLAGLQGAGKTTSSGKLAKLLMERHKS